jgi:hypothetical protein
MQQRQLTRPRSQPYELHINQMQLDDSPRSSVRPETVTGTQPRPVSVSQVGKIMRRRRLVAVQHRVVFGTQRASEARPQAGRSRGTWSSKGMSQGLYVSNRARIASMRLRLTPKSL